MKTRATQMIGITLPLDAACEVRRELGEAYSLITEIAEKYKQYKPIVHGVSWETCTVTEEGDFLND